MLEGFGNIWKSVNDVFQIRKYLETLGKSRLSLQALIVKLWKSLEIGLACVSRFYTPGGTPNELGNATEIILAYGYRLCLHSTVISTCLKHLSSHQIMSCRSHTVHSAKGAS
jgi:hypothetical protein